MPERNEAIVRAFQDAYQRGDYDAALAAMDPEVVYEWDMGTYHGLDGLRRIYSSWHATWKDYRAETEELVGYGDRVVALIRNRGRSRTSQAELDERVAMVYTLRSGRVVHMKTYRDRDEAIQAATAAGSRFRRPALMGVLNVTPDSFSDGGLYLDPSVAVAHGEQLAREGADLIDVGGESTRPGAEAVPHDEELRRVVPVIEELASKISVPLSIDTTKAAVARAALAAGASFVNDVSALRLDSAMAALVKESEADLCLMHMQGEPRTMQEDPRYEDVVSEVKSFLEERLAFAVREGIPEQRIWLDPGIGFGKTIEHNLELLRRLGEIAAIGRPVVVGASRKRFIGALTGRPEAERLAGSLAAAVLAFERGASMLRVHDVRETREALAVAGATLKLGTP